MPTPNKPHSGQSRSAEPTVGVLLVDDNADNLLALEAILAPLKCRLLRATSGEDALKILLDEDCAVILLDVNMPGLSGYETAALIRERERTAHVPIIFLTAYHKDEADVVRGYSYGAVDYVFKPVSAEIIRAKVDSFIALAVQTHWLQEKNRQLSHAEQELKGAKIAAAETDARWRKQNQILVELARSAVGEFHDLNTALVQITTATAQTLGVERVGVWLFDPEGSIVRCRDLYERSADRHTAGSEMVSANLPAFFKMLEEERTIATHAVRSDPRMAELLDHSLIPPGVVARLDAPIRRGGRVVGLVCYEHVGPTRQWSPVEQHFAASTADIVALAIDAVERGEVIRDLEQSKRDLQQSQAALQEKIGDLEKFQDVVVGRELKMMELEKELQQLRLEVAKLRPQEVQK